MAPQNRDIRFLLVEDDDVDAMAVVREFRKLNMEGAIIRAVNGREALDILRRKPGAKDAISPPFIILLDLNMPVMGGIEFLGELRKDDRLKPSIVFVLTTSEAESDLMSAYCKNIAGYIVKSNLRNHFPHVIAMINDYCDIVVLPR